MSYINNTDPTGYLVHEYCPFDYCNVSVLVNLNIPDGADSQCAFEHAGLLCGACKSGLSLSLGSSRCLKCPTNWPAFFVSIAIAAILAGILLVILILWLNLTVVVGTLSGLLFYANIVSANRVVLLPFSEPNFITVFISWLNLELGIDVCFIKGMNTYIKTWIYTVSFSDLHNFSCHITDCHQSVFFKVCQIHRKEESSGDIGNPYLALLW